MNNKINGTDIVLKDIVFSYETTSPVVLNDINLRIAKGERIAIVGPSGAGKSTLVHTLLRLSRPNSGTIQFGGIDIEDIHLDWYRKQYGVVPQNPMVFQSSIRYNIILGRNDISEDDFRRATFLSGVDEFASSLPESYETIVGQGSGSLSGGQRQRIAIARAILTRPPILILDEATSALDYETEELLCRNFKELSEGATTIVVSHRLSTIRWADRICTVIKGQIVEEGSHDVLIQRGGWYAGLNALQCGYSDQDIFLARDTWRGADYAR
jgi:subfamily B ATP-binding cassette protein HlyB/CyaB